MSEKGLVAGAVVTVRGDAAFDQNADGTIKIPAGTSLLRIVRVDPSDGTTKVVFLNGPLKGSVENWVTTAHLRALNLEDCGLQAEIGRQAQSSREKEAALADIARFCARGHLDVGEKLSPEEGVRSTCGMTRSRGQDHHYSLRISANPGHGHDFIFQYYGDRELYWEFHTIRGVSLATKGPDSFRFQLTARVHEGGANSDDGPMYTKLNTEVMLVRFGMKWTVRPTIADSYLTECWFPIEDE